MGPVLLWPVWLLALPEPLLGGVVQNRSHPHPGRRPAWKPRPPLACCPLDPSPQVPRAGASALCWDSAAPAGRLGRWGLCGLLENVAALPSDGLWRSIGPCPLTWVPVRSDWEWICRLGCWVLTESRIDSFMSACCAHSGSASTGRRCGAWVPDAGALERCGGPVPGGWVAPWLWVISFSKPKRRRGAEHSGHGAVPEGSCPHPRPCTPRPGDSAALSAGSKESLFSCALTASEEAMAMLEEVVLYAFQQCVYYVSKVPRHVRLGLERQPSGPPSPAPPAPWPRPLSPNTRSPHPSLALLWPRPLRPPGSTLWPLARCPSHRLSPPFRCFGKQRPCPS